MHMLLHDDYSIFSTMPALLSPTFCVAELCILGSTFFPNTSTFLVLAKFIALHMLLHDDFPIFSTLQCFFSLAFAAPQTTSL